MKADDRLLAELERATHGLLFMSEADYPFETVLLRAETEHALYQQLRELASAAPEAPLETVSVDAFFRAAVSEPDWKGDAEIALARKYQALVRLLKENLKDLTVYRVGRVSIVVFILGRSITGNWLGIRTRVVET